MSTRRSSCPPTRSMASSCTALSNLACADGDRSATSSRNSVPRSAASNLPRRARTPVATRSSMPNSSASTNVSTSAAQLTATNGPRRRPLRSCTCRATSSLPDPVSPWINTVKSVAATRSICPLRCCMPALDPMSGDARSAVRPLLPAAVSRRGSNINPRHGQRHATTAGPTRPARTTGRDPLRDVTRVVPASTPETAASRGRGHPVRGWHRPVG